MDNRKLVTMSVVNALLCCLAFLMLPVLLIACANQPTDKISTNNLTLAVIDGLNQNLHFPDQNAKQDVIDGMLQAASDLNIELIFQSDTAFDTVQFFFDSLHSTEINGVLYAQAYNQQAIDGIENATLLPVPVVTIDIPQADVGDTRAIVNIAASAPITARQILTYVQSQQLQNGLCLFDPSNTESWKSDAICQTLQVVAGDDNIVFDTIALTGTQQVDVLAINNAIDQNEYDTLLFHSMTAAQQYIRQASSNKLSTVAVGVLSSASVTTQELTGSNIDFVIHEDFFAKGYLAVLHLSLYIVSGQVAGVGLRHIESGSHIIAP